MNDQQNANKLLNGVFPAKIKDYTVTEAKNGNAQAAIQLDLDLGNGQTRTLTWYGSFAGGAKDITLKSLIYCGLKNQDFGRLNELVNGINSGLLDVNKQITATVESTTEYDANTGQEKYKTKIAWINDPARAPKMEKIDLAKNQQFFSTMGFDNDLVRLAAELDSPKNQGTGNMQVQQNGGMQNQNQMQQGNYQQNNGMQNQMPTNGGQNYNPMNQGQPGNAPF